jgi:hypothetical protein
MRAIASPKLRWSISIVIGLLCGAGVTGLGEGDSFYRWRGPYAVGAMVPRRGQLELWLNKEIPYEEAPWVGAMPGITWLRYVERSSFDLRVLRFWYGYEVGSHGAYRRTTVIIPAWAIVLATIIAITLISGRDLFRRVRKSQRGFAVITELSVARGTCR